MSDDDRVRETYREYDESGRAHLWDRSNPGYAMLADGRDVAILSLLDHSLPVGSVRFLDVGCGDGSLVQRVTRQWSDVEAIGLDLLPDRIEAAQTAVPAGRFVVGSADELPFDDASFDAVAAITLFSSIPSAATEAAAAREIGRVLKPGGWLVWYDLRYDNPSNPAVHGVTKRRLGELFPGWERRLSTLTLVPPLARRLGPLTPIAYPLLHAIPPLRSHLIGRLRCPT